MGSPFDLFTEDGEVLGTLVFVTTIYPYRRWTPHPRVWIPFDPMLYRRDVRYKKEMDQIRTEWQGLEYRADFRTGSGNESISNYPFIEIKRENGKLKVGIR